MSKLLEEIKNLKGAVIVNYSRLGDLESLDNLYEKGVYSSCVERWGEEYEEYLSKNFGIENDFWYNFFKNVDTIQMDSGDGVFVLFRYKQDCDFDYDKLVRQCRSIVLDVKNMEVVIYPFDKFFNINEREETIIENVEEIIKNATYLSFTNKLDGSMQCARFYNDRIIMSGSKSLERKNSWRLDSGYKFLESDMNLQTLIKTYPHTTFIFEHISEEDKHVVKYNKNEYGLHLISARDLNGEHWTYEELKNKSEKFGVDITQKEDGDLLDIMFKKLKYSASEKEGWVMHAKVYDEDFFVKIKCDDYLGVHKIINSLRSDNSIIKAIATNSFDDFISVVPNDYKSEINDKYSIISSYINTIERLTEESVIMCKEYSSDNKKQQIWITNNINSKFANNVRRMLRGQECQFIQINTKMEDILDFEIENFYKF